MLKKLIIALNVMCMTINTIPVYAEETINNIPQEEIMDLSDGDLKQEITTDLTSGEHSHEVVLEEPTQLENHIESHSEEIVNIQNNQEETNILENNNEITQEETMEPVSENTQETEDTITENILEDYVVETVQEEEQKVYYYDEDELELLDYNFASKRLIISMNDSMIVEKDSVIASFTPKEGDTVYLLQFETELDTKKAYLHYLSFANSVDIDVPTIMAQEEITDSYKETVTEQEAPETPSYEGLESSEMTPEENPLNELNNQIDTDVQEIIESTEEELTVEEAREMIPMMLLGSSNSQKVIAMLDTGVGRKTSYDADHVVNRVTMLSDSSNPSGYDDNGHGNAMYEHILDEAPDAKILSIKVLNNEGKGDLSALYAGIMYAVEQGVDIISMSLSAYQPGSSTLIDNAIQQAVNAGITVVAAAGNDGRDASDYVPARVNNVITIGAAKVNGTRQELSNYGDVVEYNVIANSTSEATARFAGILYRDGLDAINSTVNTDEVYTTDYVPQGGTATPEGSGQTPGLPGEVTTPTNVDIVSLSDQVAYGAKLEGGKWVKTPTSDAAGQRYTFRVNYSTSGVGETEKGGVRFTIPKSILLDRNNNLSDTFEMSVPHENEWDETDDVDFVYYVDGDTIVLYNIRELSAAINGYFEVSYLTNKKTFQYQDMKANNPFNVVMSVGGKTRTADDLVTYMNTNVRIVSTKKELPGTLYRSWQPSWGDAPANANGYYYLIWRIDSNIYDDSTQPYTFTLNDTVLSEGEVVGYKLAYQSGFTSMNSVDFQNTTDTRYDSVLTRHLKSHYDLNDDYWIFKNKVVATVTPSDGIDPSTTASSTREFRYRIPRFTVPSGHFNQWKHADGYWRETKRNYGHGQTMLSYLGNRANEYSRYDLETLQNGDVNYLPNFDYAVYEAGYPYPWTYQDVTGNGPLDPDNYGVKPVKYELIDNDEMYLDDFKLNPGDYQIDHLSFGWTMRDAIFDDESQSFIPTTVTYTDSDIVTFYGNFGDGNLIEIGTYNLKTGVHNFDGTYINQVETIDSKGSIRLYPVDGMIGYKIETSNAHYFTELDSVPNYRLIGTERVLDYIQDLDDITLINKSHGRFYESDGTLILNVNTQDEDYARIIERDSKIQKKIVSSANNTKKKYYNIGWRVEMNENYTIGDGETYAMEQESGTFYDILPLGGNLVLESIAVRTQNGYLDENAYEVSTTPNYKGSGRTLLTVKIKEPGNYYCLYYDTNHPWDSIKDYGNDVYNPVAYETGNKDIANGLPDDGGNLTDKTLMSDLDPNTNDKKFIYDDVLDNIALITAALSGLQKKVKTDKDKNYSYDTTTTNNGYYQYRLRFMNSYVNSAKDMVLFDDLENYETPEGEVSDWFGTLQAVDLQQIRDKGIDVKMYINTQHVDMSQYNDNTPVDDILSGWILVDNNTDLSQAKAIAIDMRKATDGSDYVLDVGESVSAILYMQSPNGTSDPQGGYPETYNNIWIHDTVISTLGGEETFLIHQDYTTVRLLITQDLKIHKVSEEDSSISIPNIKFRLKGTSDYGAEVDEIKATDKNGKLTFKDVEKGSYILQEYESTEDWLLDPTEYTVVIDSAGVITINGQDYTDIYYQITNKPRVHGDLNLQKRREGTSAEEELIIDEIASKNIGDTVTVDGKIYEIKEKESDRAKLKIVPQGEAYAVFDEGDGSLTFFRDEHGKYTNGQIQGGKTYFAGFEEDLSPNYWRDSEISPYIYSIHFNDIIAPTDLKSFFYRMPNVETVDLTLLDTSKASDMRNMFGESGFVSLDLSLFDTSNVSMMGNMFATQEENGPLQSVDLSSFGKGPTVGCINMFKGQNNLTTIYASDNWNDKTGLTSNRMFEGATSLPNFDSAYTDKTKAHYGDDGYFTYKKAPELYAGEIWYSLEKKLQSPIVDTTFKLHGTSDYGNDILEIGTTNSVGKLSFKNIELGTYTLEEITPNPDYILNTTKWTVRVDEQGNVFVVEPGDASLRDRLYQVENLGNSYGVSNEPRYWAFTLRKVDKKNDTIWIEGAEFTLSGISELGTEYNKVVLSNENGRVVFDRIEKGTYILKETKAPTGVTETGKSGGNRNYVADPNEYVVHIDNQGNVTIEGLTENQYDDFVVKNDRAYDGKITIVKKWEDDTTNDNRPTPVVHLSTDEPSWKHGITVTKVWEGDTPENRPEDIKVYLGEYIDSTLTPIMTSQDNIWTKNQDNTWTYTFDILLEGENADKELYVWEEGTEITISGGKYTVANGESNPVKVVDQKATITNRYENMP